MNTTPTDDATGLAADVLSPNGAFWKLCIAAKHTPRCRAMDEGVTGSCTCGLYEVMKAVEAALRRPTPPAPAEGDAEMREVARRLASSPRIEKIVPTCEQAWQDEVRIAVETVERIIRARQPKPAAGEELLRRIDAEIHSRRSTLERVPAETPWTISAQLLRDMRAYIERAARREGSQ